jgi:hypothetical protein
MGKWYVMIIIALIGLKSSAQENGADSAGAKWSFSAWAEQFILPGERDYFNPTFYARTKTVHLEGRYNYEDANTASFWAGRRFVFGKNVKFVVVPMAAIVVGNSNGLAAGLETEVTFRKFDFYSESEHLFDFESKENNFFYMYSEVAIRPIHAIRTGLIAQRTKLFETEHEVQRGFFGEYYFGRFRAGVFYFNPFSADHFWIASFSVDF